MNHRGDFRGRLRAVVLSCGLVVSLDGAAQCQLRSVSHRETEFVFRDVGTATGFLTLTEGLQGHGAGWGDVNGDGWPDLYIATFHYEGTQPNLLLQNQAGTFRLDPQTSVRISTRATGVVFADFDNDGDLDLYVASMPVETGSSRAERTGRALRGCSMFRNDGAGRFVDISDNNAACPEEFGGRSATVLDYDGDGLLDLLVGEDPVSGYNGSSTRTSRLFRNRGALTFEDLSGEAGIPHEAAGLGVAAADVNGDSWPDVFLASTLGNYLLLNNGNGRFYEPSGARETFEWPTAKGDDMVCGVVISDVNGDALPDLVLGQHYNAPWRNPVANRLYLHRGVVDAEPVYEDVTERAGLVALPMKAPHVEIQDFDNDTRPDILTSVVFFEHGQPHPLLFRNMGTRDGLPQFAAPSLLVNDFPTAEDKSIRRSSRFFEKMIADRKVFYSAPAPTCDFDRDGRLDVVLPSWWPELPSRLLRNETVGGHWIDVEVRGKNGVNAMGIGARVDVYEAGRSEDESARIGSREIATGYGYASSQEAIAHFGLGSRAACDIVVTLPHGNGQIIRKHVQANRRIRIAP